MIHRPTVNLLTHNQPIGYCQIPLRERQNLVKHIAYHTKGVKRSNESGNEELEKLHQYVIDHQLGFLKSLSMDLEKPTLSIIIASKLETIKNTLFPTNKINEFAQRIKTHFADSKKYKQLNFPN